MTPLEPLKTIPSDIESLADYERHAIAHMPPETWRHIQNGTDRELTLIANRNAFDTIGFVPRAMSDLRGGSTGLQLFGRTHVSPILLAPAAYMKLAHPDGELATVRAAMALDIAMVVSTLSSVSLEEIATAAGEASTDLGRVSAPLWFQLYLQEDRHWSASLVERAEAAGYEAIVLTIDAAIKRTRFTLPQGVDAANLRTMPRRTQTARPGGSILFDTPLLDAAPRWEDLNWLRNQTKLPLIVKGIMSPDDARQAVDLGADAVMVSNHGGRVLDGLPSPLSVLPAIKQAVGDRFPLLLDSGIRSGGDIAKALALGATAILVGRPQYHAAAVAGMTGVAHMLHILRAELEYTMAQLGCSSLSDLTPERLTKL